MERKLVTAMAQMDAVFGDVQANLRRVLAMMDEASAQGADIICFPELCTTGYNLELLGSAIAGMGLAAQGPELEAVRKQAKAQQLAVILPAAEQRDGQLYNSAFVIDKDGSLQGSFSKVHLFELERDHFTPGSSFPLFVLGDVKIGIMICYDMGFPEAARALVLQGADILFAPSAWRIQDEEIWDLNTRSRALENSVFVCGVNRVGQEADLHLFGGSRLVDPCGKIIRQMPADIPGVAVQALDLAAAARARKYYRYLQQRRPDAYGPGK